MFGKIGAYLSLFRKGTEVANVEKWKSHQITGTMVAGFLIALLNLAKAYGYDLPIDTNDINQLGVGIIAVANIVLTCTTSKRAGLLPAKPNADDGSSVPGQAPAAVQPAGQEPQVQNAVPPVSEPAPQSGVPDFEHDIYIG